MCDPAWAPAAAATVAIRAIRATTLDGEAATSEGACTGTLVGGPDTSKVYVISAAHCFASARLGAQPQPQPQRWQRWVRCGDQQ